MRQRLIEFRFLSTLSLRRATGLNYFYIIKITNFYPRSPCGERQWTPLYSPVRCYFYPRSPCGERRPPGLLHSYGGVISIHALLAESDDFRRAFKRAICNFYPRSPCGERPAIDVFLAVWAIISIHALLAESDFAALHNILKLFTFLSTLSLRRATECTDLFLSTPPHFYPRSPCGERPLVQIIISG